MRKHLFFSCGLLLASFGLSACATSGGCCHSHTVGDKEIVPQQRLYTLKAHRRPDYRSSYSYSHEVDRFARMERWRDPVFVVQASK